MHIRILFVGLMQDKTQTQMSKTNWIFTSDSIPEPATEDPDNSYYVLGSKGWSYAPLVVYYSYISREFMSRETNAPVKGILFWTALPDQPGINDKGKLTSQCHE